MTKFPKNVLIVDDEALIAMFLQDIVEDLHYDIAGIAPTFDEAVRLAEENNPGIALVDLNIKGSGNGIDVARRLAESYGTAIIFLSGDDNLAGREDISALNPVAVLSKPCLPEEIERALKSAELSLER